MKLDELRNGILDDLLYITDDLGVDPIDKFDILMTRYTSTGDVSLLTKMHATTKLIDDISLRGNALVQLLDEVNALELNNLDSEEGVE